MSEFAPDVELGNGVSIAGLTVFPLTSVPHVNGPSYLTGPAAFEVGLITVGELDPPEVPSLAVSNLAEVPILLIEGEMLLGGDQDRTMNVSVLCPPMERIVVPVSCVESGRWGSSRKVCASSRHAPGSLRSLKTAFLEGRANGLSSRRSDQGRVWEEIDHELRVHNVHSETAALDEVQQEIERNIHDQLETFDPMLNQVGVVCFADERVMGLDLFDSPSTLERYLRQIITGHALDVRVITRDMASSAAAYQFLEKALAGEWDKGPGVGLGEEIRLSGDVAGIGLLYSERLLHLASFPMPA